MKVRVLLQRAIPRAIQDSASPSVSSSQQPGTFTQLSGWLFFTGLFCMLAVPEKL
jgi:hypothetical protein